MPNNVKVLLVDDNPMVLGLLHGALTPLARVTTSSDTADALLKAVDDPPDLLVSDYRMPGMDGHQLVEKLRSRPKTAWHCRDPAGQQGRHQRKAFPATNRSTISSKNRSS